MFADNQIRAEYEKKYFNVRNLRYALCSAVANFEFVRCSYCQPRFAGNCHQCSYACLPGGKRGGAGALYYRPCLRHKGRHTVIQLKTTFWVKIALIPFFIINFIIWALFWLATINPFLILFGPFIWVISLFATYVFMIGGGLQNIVYLVKRYLAERQFRYLLYAVLHFIYIADIVAAGLACYDEKKAKNQCPDAV